MSGAPPGRRGGAARETAFARRMGSRTRPHSEPRAWPGDPEFRFRLWALTDHEVTGCRARALLFLQTYFKGLDAATPAELYLAADEDFFTEEFERQLLAAALRDPDAPDYPLADVGELRLQIGPDERRALMAAYNDWLDACSPLTKVRTEAELQELVSVLGKEPSAREYLSYCDIVTLRSIARALAGRLTAQTRPSSPST